MRTMKGVVGVLAAGVALLVALIGQAHAIAIIGATSSDGTVTVSGIRAAASADIIWEGTVVTVSSKRGSFTFTATGVPTDCVGTLSDGVTTIPVALAGCTVALPPPTALLVTGQTTCWDVRGDVIACRGTGQDGEIKAGIRLRYTSHDNGTITDDNTGLVWEKKTLDNVFDAYTFDEAFDYVAGLNAARFAGYTDWRVPNVRELQSLIDYGQFGPAVSPEFNDCANGSCTVSGNYWSSTTAAASTLLGWRVNFYDGFQLVGGKVFTMRVRAVRGGL